MLININIFNIVHLNFALKVNISTSAWCNVLKIFVGMRNNVISGFIVALFKIPIFKDFIGPKVIIINNYTCDLTLQYKNMILCLKLV